MVGIPPIYGDEWGMVSYCYASIIYYPVVRRERFGARGIPIPIPYRFPYTNEQMTMTSMTSTKCY